MTDLYDLYLTVFEMVCKEDKELQRLTEKAHEYNTNPDDLDQYLLYEGFIEDRRKSIHGGMTSTFVKAYLRSLIAQVECGEAATW